MSNVYFISFVRNMFWANILYEYGARSRTLSLMYVEAEGDPTADWKLLEILFVFVDKVDFILGSNLAVGSLTWFC